MWGGGSSGEKIKKGKSGEGRKDAEMVKGQQEMLFGGKVRREKSQDLLSETFGSQQIKFLCYLLGGIEK